MTVGYANSWFYNVHKQKFPKATGFFRTSMNDFPHSSLEYNLNISFNI